MLYGVCKGGYSQRGLGGCQKGTWAQVQFLVSGAKLKLMEPNGQPFQSMVREYSRVPPEYPSRRSLLVSGDILLEPNGRPFQSMVSEYSRVPLACS